MKNRQMAVIILIAMAVAIAGLVIALIWLTSSDTPAHGEPPGADAAQPPTITFVNQSTQTVSSSGPFLLPDCAVINSPTAIGFDVEEAVGSNYLGNFSQDYYGVRYSGAEMVEKTAVGHSIHPKLLLALIEYQSGWVSAQNIGQVRNLSGLGLDGSDHGGFYQELYWAADRVAYGYYARRVGALNSVGLLDGTTISLPEDMNSGSAGVYYFFSLVCDQSCWKKAITEDGFSKTYLKLFGDPYAGSVEPLLPVGLTQPVMQLPFEIGKIWSFTGGPHAAWGDGSAWAALDFAPPKEELGCIPTEEWLTAVADGVIVRSELALVMLDLDGDGYEQTGWNILYYHVDTADRIPAGTSVKAGDRIGHPSCEGGFSTGTHVHIARKYNGEWIPADQEIPFNLDGWISSGSGSVYDGFLSKNGKRVEALDGKDEANQISR